MADEQDGRGGRPRPGLFRSWGDLAFTLVLWMTCALIIAPVIGVVAHVLYLLFTWGWDLI